MSLISEIKTNLNNLDLSKRNLRKFSITIAIVLFLFGILVFWKGSVKENAYYLLIIAFLFLLSGLLIPKILTLIYKVWMGLAFTLGWFMTRVILGIMFYLVFTPIGLSIRLFGGDLLKKKLDRNTKSYWIKREKVSFDKTNYEHLF